jgi:hypothetical protein
MSTHTHRYIQINACTHMHAHTHMLKQGRMLSLLYLRTKMCITKAWGIHQLLSRAECVKSQIQQKVEEEVRNEPMASCGLDWFGTGMAAFTCLHTCRAPDMAKPCLTGVVPVLKTNAELLLLGTTCLCDSIPHKAGDCWLVTCFENSPESRGRGDTEQQQVSLLLFLFIL